MRKTIFILAVAMALLLAGCTVELAEAPVISVQEVSGGKQITITTSVEKAVIRYTLDGSDPDSKSNVYSSPFTISDDTIIKAVAVKGKRIVSEVATKECSFKLSTLSADLAGGTYVSSQFVRLSCDSDCGPTIHYTTDGTTPDASSPTYSGSLEIDRSMTLKAIAIREGYHDSDVLSLDYVIKMATPSSNTASGRYVGAQSVLVYCSSSGATLHYTTDGSVPTASSDTYSESIYVNRSMTLKVIAVKEGCEDSEVLSMDFVIKSPIAYASPAAGSYLEPQNVGLVSGNGAIFHYTTDGSTPTLQSPTCAFLNITEDTTLKVLTEYVGCEPSDVVTFEYKIGFRYGMTGPAGGYLFYDCDADNDETNDGAGPDGLMSSVCGWRYLEAAPDDISVGSTTKFQFGYYRSGPNLTNWYVSGSTTYLKGTSDASDGRSTGTAIGTGKANTAKLVDKMKNVTYSDVNGSDTTTNYAAKLCDDYTYGGQSDWFLPSKDELNLMYENLYLNDFGGFCSDLYWSSSESENWPYNAIDQSFENGSQYLNSRRRYYLHVRAIREFI